MILFLLSTFLFIAGLIIVYWAHNQYHLDIIVTPQSPPKNLPLISICIPARNEEKNIRKCVESVLQQDYPNIEVIVLDDRSTDTTLDLLKVISAKDSRLIPINGSDLPLGWAGKPHALIQASAVAKGKWLCFVDADTFLSPQALSSCYAKAIETGADLFTVMTKQILGSFWEKTIMPLIMTGLSIGFSPRKVNDVTRKDAIANGQFIFIKRTVYDAIGGHEKIKSQIAEDKALAEQVKWNGYRLIVADGVQIINTRMYTSLTTMWEGWTKNIYLGLRDQPILLWLGLCGVFFGLVVTFFLPIWSLLGILWFFYGGSWMAVAVIFQGLIVWVYLMMERIKIAHKMEISGWYALTTSLGAGMFTLMMIVSAWKILSGQGVSWRGRIYHDNQ